MIRSGVDLSVLRRTTVDVPAEFLKPAGSPRDPETGDLLPEDPLDAPDFQPDFLEGSEERE